MSGRSKSVFVGPVEVAGFTASLSTGFEENGWQVYSLDSQINPFAYSRVNHSKVLGLLQAVFAFLSRFRSVPGSATMLWPLRTLLFSIAFIWVACRCQACVFVFGRSFLPFNLDLPILKLLRKRIIIVYLGSDSRPVYLSGGWHLREAEASLEEKAEICLKATRRQKRRVCRVHAWSDVVVNSPLCAVLLPGEFANWFVMGFPTKLAATIPEKGSWGDEGPIVVHAPSWRALKGSDIIESTLEKLKSEGIKFRYRSLVEVPNETVQEMLEEAHVVIDELYSDCPLAGLGVEAAAKGCAVVVGGDAWEQLEATVPGESLAASVQTSEKNLERDLRSLLVDEKQCREVGVGLRDFIQREWDCKKVAGRYIRLIEGDVPDGWILDADSLGYAAGMGALPAAFEPLISKIVAEHGIEGLGIDSGSLRAKLFELNNGTVRLMRDGGPSHAA